MDEYVHSNMVRCKTFPAYFIPDYFVYLQHLMGKQLPEMHFGAIHRQNMALKMQIFVSCLKITLMSSSSLFQLNIYFNAAKCVLKDCL